MSNEILYILLPDFAAHEMVYLMEAVSSDEQQLKPNPKYVNKIVAESSEPVAAIGGFKVIPDYTFGDMPDDYGESHQERKNCRSNLQWCFLPGKK